MHKFICIHGHFYQPPRENPWTGEIDQQASASPFHDWNQRINKECYLSNAAVYFKDEDITINNYEYISFNFGPTLLSWMEKHQPETYQKIIESDKNSLKHFSGHGSALAQVYNHMIMPLANRRDKETQIIWGIRDFQKRFGRYPEGMWLAETAVDLETLELLADNEIKFTILAPHQIKSILPRNSNKWLLPKEYPGFMNQPITCELPNGKVIHVFAYNGSLSSEIAFGEVLKDGKLMASKLIDTFEKNVTEDVLVHIATDGETYGHHHKFGNMALAYSIKFLLSSKDIKLTNYGEYLEHHSNTILGQIQENSSWSCSHGIERWRADCGCALDTKNKWDQKWRAPLRNGLNWLRDQSIEVFEQQMTFIADPWEFRNQFISVVVADDDEQQERFVLERIPLASEEEIKVAKACLRMQRDAMLMFTSCGWFFDDISGLEVRQILQYAAKVIEYIEKLTHLSVEEEFLGYLKNAKSNIPSMQNGRQIYIKYIKPLHTSKSS